jgi:hypothetical protein
MVMESAVSAANWVPAFAGMTLVVAEMTQVGSMQSAPTSPWTGGGTKARTEGP